MTSPTSTLVIRNRRSLLAAGAAAIAGASAFVESAAAAAEATTSTSASIPMTLPRSEFVYEAVVELERKLDLGQSPFGERRMVPITGGAFEGPNIHGRVMPGGADRQLVRRDGAVSFDAVYELQTHDGAVISVRNRVLSRPARDGQPRYAFSTLDIVAPDGPYGWLNDFVYVGTLNSLGTERRAVLIRVYRII